MAMVSNTRIIILIIVKKNYDLKFEFTLFGAQYHSHTLRQFVLKFKKI